MRILIILAFFTVFLPDFALADEGDINGASVQTHYTSEEDSRLKVVNAPVIDYRPDNTARIYSNTARIYSNDYDYDGGRGGNYNDFSCKIVIVINLDRFFQFESDAFGHCQRVNSLFGSGCSTRYVRGRGYGGFFNREWSFTGTGSDWSSSRRNAFDRYFNWTIDNGFGFGQDFGHHVFFDRCSG